MLILNVKWLLTWQASSPVTRDQPLKSGPEIKPRQISSFAYTKPIVKRFPVSGGGIFCGSCVACPTASNGASQWRWVPVTHGFYRHPVWLVPNMELVLKSNLGCDCLYLIQMAAINYPGSRPHWQGRGSAPVPGTQPTPLKCPV